MEVRLRGNKLQLVRPGKPNDKGRGKPEVVTKLPLGTTQIPEDIRKQLSVEENAIIAESLGHYARKEGHKAELITRTLGDNIQVAVRWLNANQNSDGRGVAKELIAPVRKLRLAVRGLLGETQEFKKNKKK